MTTPGALTMPSPADVLVGLAQSPDPWVRLVAAADDLRGQLPDIDDALIADGPYGHLRRHLVALAQDRDPLVRAVASSSALLPVEVAEAVADMGGPGQLCAGWVDILSEMGGDCDDMSVRLAVEVPAGETVSPWPRAPQVWGALAHAKTPVPRLVALLVPALAAAAAEHYGPEDVAMVVAELAADPDPRVATVARSLPPGWPR